MSKTSGTKSGKKSLNDSAPARTGLRGSQSPKTGGNVTAGGKGDRDGKGDIQAKKANTSIAKKGASK